jgi:hypothetical protein
LLIKGLVETINRLEGVPKPGSKPAVKVVAKAMAKEAVLAVVTELIFGFALASLGIAACPNECGWRGFRRATPGKQTRMPMPIRAPD